MSNNNKQSGNAAVAEAEAPAQSAAFELKENLSPTQDFIRSHSDVTIEDIDAMNDMGPIETSELLPLTGKVIKVTLPNRVDNQDVVVSRPETIADLNKDFTYLWLAESSLKGGGEFSNGQYFVASRSNVGGQNIPTKYFNSDGVVIRNGCFLCFTSAKVQSQRNANSISAHQRKITRYDQSEEVGQKTVITNQISVSTL